MEIVVCGVRGSTPAPGREFDRIGGHTSCLAMRAPSDRWLILDAGTGFRRVADLLDGGPLHGTILLSHLHWDHTQGLPFLANADRDDASVDLLLPRPLDAATTVRAVEVLGRAMSPPHFPIEPTGLHGQWSFGFTDPGELSIEGLDVRVDEISHKGGRTFGFRISDGSASFAYMPDHSPATATADELAAADRLAAGVDLLIHDSQFIEEERARADDFGHATIGDAMEFAARNSVRHLALFHHAPARTDDQVADIASALTSARRAGGVGRLRR